ncbi:MAG: tRNA-dihydrouridine synthase family protein [Candidatus Diapherotrites archaeon]
MSSLKELISKPMLAPMYRVSDLPYRILCRKLGAGMCFTEMINVQALNKNNKATIELAKTHELDIPVSAQLIGVKPKEFSEAINKLPEFNSFCLNLDCPSEFTTINGSGAILMKRPARIAEIIKEMRNSRSNALICAKIRLKENILESIKLSKLIESNGADYLIVHARTIKQKNSGYVNLVALKRIKKEIGIPVIGNGSIKSKNDAEKITEKTKCNGIMIGKEAIENPNVFTQFSGIKPFSREALEKEFLKLCKSTGFEDKKRIEKHLMKLRA